MARRLSILIARRLRVRRPVSAPLLHHSAGKHVLTLSVLLLHDEQALVKIPPLIAGTRPEVQKAVNFLVELILAIRTGTASGGDGSGDLQLPDFARAYYFAIAFTLGVIVLQLLVMLASIRRNLLQAFRGDDSEIPRSKSSSNISYVTGNFRFAGCLIGYVVLAFVFLGFLSLIVSILIGTVINSGSARIFEDIVRSFVPAFLFIVFKMYLNKSLARYVFLQQNTSVLSLNNRRAFMIFLYFNIFLDAFLGLFAAIMRLLKSSIGGILYMCRLDYSPLGRKLETRDAGFSAYCGFIHVECAHRHPVLLCFMSHLLRSQIYGPSTKRWSKARHKWALAVFLLNNPTLIYQRKRFLANSEDRAMKLMLIGRKNRKAVNVDEQEGTLTRRTTVASQIELEEGYERVRF